MATIDCVDVDAESGRCGDAHYRDMGIWIRSRLNQEFLETARESALAYQAALILLVECLMGHPSTPRIEKRLEVIIGLQALIVKDLEVMTKYRTGFKV